VLESHVVELSRQQPRPNVQRLQACILHPVFSAHLFDEQLGVGANVNSPDIMVHRPLQRGEKAVIFRDVVGRYSQSTVQFVEDGAIG
jgi:hypothetical protein